MERRVLLAVVLSIGLIFLVQVLFPPVPVPVDESTDVPAEAAGEGAARVAVEETVPAFDTIDAAGRPGDAVAEGAAGEEPPAAAREAPGREQPGPEARVEVETGPAVPEDTIRVRSELYEYAFGTRGASLLSARPLRFDSYAAEDAEGDPVELIPEGERFLRYGVAVGGDTVRLDDRAFTVSTDELILDEGVGRDSLTFTYQFPGGAARLLITYRFRHDGYLVDVDGRVEGLESRGYVLLADLASTLRTNEKDVDDDRNQFALVVNGRESGVEKMDLDELEPGEVRPATGGPFRWVAVKSKYFLVAAVAPEDGPLFGGATIRDAGSGREPRITTSLPVPAGSGGFSFRLYAGPQDYGRLDAIGQDLQDVNSFGYDWLQPVFRPLVAIVMPILVWMHTRFDLAYGWVLILFGVLMRVVLFPLYQKSMRAQIGQMRLQPVVQDIRERYKDDPQKMQQEMVRVYREEGVNPFAGCLPMLVPMPILFTLFFVFQGTIEFRGVPFLWLPDLSLKDPYYIIPVVMGLSMFLLQWIGQRSMTSTNTQMKAMMYGMPVVLTFLFANFPSGLNLYYTTSNLASLPQQLYIARERKAAGLHDPGTEEAAASGAGRKTPGKDDATRAGKRKGTKKARSGTR